MPVFAAPARETTTGGLVVLETTAAVDAQTAEDKKSVYPNWWCWPATLLLVALGVLFGTMLYNGGPEVTFTPPTGVGIFALFYILAQVIERIQEPFAPYLGTTKATDPEDTNKTRVVNQRDARASLDIATADAATNSTDATKAKAAATAQRNVDQVRANATVIAFGVASLLAMLGAGLLEALLLETVGVEGLGSSGENVIWVDVLVTGLAVGAGTKPLHDLISNIKESKEGKQDKKPGE
jgi:hypothetical protein